MMSADDAAIEELARRLWALGDLARLRLLSLLPQKPTCETRTNVSQLAERLGMSQPTVSHHLRILRQAGFVEYTKHCRDCYYWRNPAAVEAVGSDIAAVLNEVAPPAPAPAETPAEAASNP